MNTLATSRLFYTHGFQTLLLIAIIFTLVGLLVGWLTWRHCRAEAERIERMNAELNDQYQKLRDKKA